MRRRSAWLKDEYRTDPPPRDGSTVLVPYLLTLSVYWDESIRRWVLNHPLQFDTINDGSFVKWKRPREDAP